MRRGLAWKRTVAPVVLTLAAVFWQAPAALADVLSTSPLVNLEQLVAAQSVGITGLAAEPVQRVVASDGSEAFVSAWAASTTSGTQWMLVSITRYFASAPDVPSTLLLAEPTASSQAYAWILGADGPTQIANVAIAGADLGDYMCDLVAGTLYAIVFGRGGPAGFVVASLATTATCSATPPTGLVWYGNQRPDDAVGPIPAGGLYAVEDLIIRPQSCIPSTSIVPCRALSDGSVKNVTAQLIHHTVWPDGYNERVFRGCAYTECAPPFRYRNCPGLTFPGTYVQKIYQDEYVPGGPAGSYPTGSVRRTYALS